MTAPIQDFWSGRKWMAAMLQTAMTIISVLPSGVNEKLIYFVIIPTCLDNLTGSRAKISNLRPTQSAT